jgi:hypothetical protein
VEKRKIKQSIITCRTSTRVRRDECVVDESSCVFSASSETARFEGGKGKSYFKINFKLCHFIK